MRLGIFSRLIHYFLAYGGGIISLVVFLCRRKRENSILIIESTNSHGEVIPTFIHYFQKLGFRVDVVIAPIGAKMLPFARLDMESVRVTVLPWRMLGIVCKAKRRVSAYEYIMFTTEYIPHRTLGSGKWPTILERFPLFSFYKGKLIFVTHHADDVPSLREAGHVITLADLGQSTNIVVPSYFGRVAITPKNEKITHFIVVGTIVAHRKNINLLIDAIRHLIEGGQEFRVTVVGTCDVPELVSPEMEQYVRVLGRVDYGVCFDRMEQADFFLPLLDPENEDHNTYLTTRTSGSFGLIYGFQKPVIIHRKFTARGRFSEDNAIIYDANADLGIAMMRAIAMSTDEYGALQKSLGVLSADLDTISFNNLKTLLSEPLIKNQQEYRQPEVIKRLDREIFFYFLNEGTTRVICFEEGGSSSAFNGFF